MENELELIQDGALANAIQDIEVQVFQGSVVFGAYDELKKQATLLAEQITTVEVSEENVKLSKKLLATVNKRLKELEDRRISIKKLMLQPYSEFEDQVKEIVGIVKDADVVVRDQVKELEAKERLAKECQIQNIFEKRVQAYTFKKLVPFSAFVTPKHLTKTMSIDAVEKEMVQFLEKVQNDMNVLETLEDSGQHIDAYLECYDLAQAMTQVKQKNERQAQIEQARKKITKKESTGKIAFLVSINVHNEKELKLLEMILQENQFEYTKDKVEL